MLLSLIYAKDAVHIVNPSIYIGEKAKFILIQDASEARLTSEINPWDNSGISSAASLFVDEEARRTTGEARRTTGEAPGEKFGVIARVRCSNPSRAGCPVVLLATGANGSGANGSGANGGGAMVGVLFRGYGAYK